MQLLILMLHYPIVWPSVAGNLTTAQQTVTEFLTTSLRWIWILHHNGAVAVVMGKSLPCAPSVRLMNPAHHMLLSRLSLASVCLLQLCLL